MYRQSEMYDLGTWRRLSRSLLSVRLQAVRMHAAPAYCHHPEEALDLVTALA